MQPTAWGHHRGCTGEGSRIKSEPSAWGGESRVLDTSAGLVCSTRREAPDARAHHSCHAGATGVTSRDEGGGDPPQVPYVILEAKPGVTAKPIQVRLGEPEPDTLRAFGGSKSDRFNNAVIDAVVKTGWFFPNESDEDRARQIFVAVTGLRAFAPPMRSRP